MSLPLTPEEITKLLYKYTRRDIPNYSTIETILKELSLKLEEKRSNINLKSLEYRSKNLDIHLNPKEKLKILEDLSVATPYNEEYKNIKLLLGDLIVFAEGLSSIINTSSRMKDFIIKYKKDTCVYEKFELLYEVFILNILNNYKNKVPNFVYMFRHFLCRPVEEMDDIKRSICDVPSFYIDTPFIIQEKINGISLKTYILGEPNTINILNYYLQVLFALETVKNFSHNDLHLNNIILKPVKDTISYKLDNEIYNIKTDKIAIMIDFGLSYISPHSNIQSQSMLSKYGVYTDRPNKAMDAYKMLMHIGYYLITSLKCENKKLKLKKIFSDLEPIFSFFVNTNNIRSHIINTFNSFYSFPSIDSYTHSKLIYYILKRYDLPFLSKGVKKISIKTSKIVKQSITSIDDLFYIIRTKKISLEELIEVRNTLKLKLKENIEKELKKIEKLNSMLIDYEVSISSYIPTIVGIYELDDLTSDQMLTYKKYEFKINSIINKFSNILNIHDANLYAEYYLNGIVSREHLNNTKRLKDINEIANRIVLIGKNKSVRVGRFTILMSNVGYCRLLHYNEKNNIKLKIEVAVTEKNLDLVKELATDIIIKSDSPDLRILDFIMHAFKHKN